MTAQTNDLLANFGAVEAAPATVAPPPAPEGDTRSAYERAVAEAADVPDLEPIFPDEKQLTVGGMPVRVVRFRARQVFGLARVIAGGLGDSITYVPGMLKDSADVKNELLGVLFVALSEAEEQMFGFLSTIVEPVNEADEGRLRAEMVNPNAGELLDVIEALVEQEADDLTALLGKAVRLAATVQQKMPQQKAKPTAG